MGKSVFHRPLVFTYYTYTSFFLCLFLVFHLTFCVDFENQLRLTAVVSGLVVCVPTTLFCESVVASRVTFAIQSVALNVASDVN